jgi:hypothetical protein
MVDLKVLVTSPTYELIYASPAAAEIAFVKHFSALSFPSKVLTSFLDYSIGTLKSTQQLC